MNFWKNKRVFVTGHTGFKGSWLCEILKLYGAEVTGYALPCEETSMFESVGVLEGMNSIIGDIRDFESLKKAFFEAKPEIVFHLAAQPIVRQSYQEPLKTYETNVLGTANLLECVRLYKDVRSVVNVTTDKVYENNEKNIAFTEDMPLDGFDPYSNSKSCSELVTHSYNKSFFREMGISVSTARAGNVIGGGDFAVDRIIPDCVRAVIKGEKVIVRNPNSIRPYQHVLEPLFAYLEIAKKQYENIEYAGYYNIGPDEEDCLKTGEIVELFKKYYKGFDYKILSSNGPHEANFLKLNCDKIKRVFGWKPLYSATIAVEKTVLWYKTYIENPQKLKEITKQQIVEYKETLKRES